MPIRYPCPAHEAGEECENQAVCLHVTEVDTTNGDTEQQQYLFGTPEAMVFFQACPEIIQQILFQLCDAGYDERRYVD